MEQSEDKGKLYLIPSLLGEVEPLEVLPLAVKKVLDITDFFIVENEKSARAFIKKVHPAKAQDKLNIRVLNKYTEITDIPTFLDPCLEGHHVGIISEAGAPGIADPGSDVVFLAHEKGIRVVPLVGPSSIFMAMMASGMNGQNFAFNGYLPIEKHLRKRRIKALENLSAKSGQTQIFMETPYRNTKLLKDVLDTCNSNTLLCIASDVSLATEKINTKPISWWKKNQPEIEKKPAIFIIQAVSAG